MCFTAKEECRTPEYIELLRAFNEVYRNYKEIKKEYKIFSQETHAEFFLDIHEYSYASNSDSYEIIIRFYASISDSYEIIYRFQALIPNSYEYIINSCYLNI